MSEDIKALLDKAFGPEPPLSLDRDAILRRGRRQVRIRRLAASGGVAAAVVAVVLSAAFLSNRPVGEEITPAQPASTRPVPVTTTPSDRAPAGPELPLSTTVSPPVRAASKARAAELTKILSSARVLPGDVKLLPLEPDSGPLVFRVSGSEYWAGARLSDASGQGIVVVAVQPVAQDAQPPRCPEHTRCTELSEAGVAMTARFAETSSGIVEYTIVAHRPDGTGVTLIATNAASTRRDETRTARAMPPVDLTQLRAIATLPGLSYG
jgi:hypothetical protein